jgi:CheY-like chemotaxis protein
MARILIIDDDPSVRLTLKAALEAAGHTVGEAANGTEGIKQFHAEPSELVITDILMPDKEGLETIADLRQIKRGLKIIAMSGGARGQALDFLDVAKRFGADATLRKPFRMADLFGVVDRCLSPAG